MTFFGILYIISTTLVLFFKREINNSGESEPNDEFSLIETYKLVFKIAKLPSIQKLIFALFTIRVSKFSCTIVLKF